MKVEVEDTIDASDEAIFAVLADIANWPRHLRSVVALEVLTSGPVGVGTRFRQTRRLYGREAHEDMTVAIFDPPRRIVLTAENHGARYETALTVTPMPRGTLLRIAFGGEANGLMARLMAPLMGLFVGGVRRQLQADLSGFKQAAEASR